MNRQDNDLDRKLDELLDGISRERLDERAAEEAAARVWERVRQEADASHPDGGRPVRSVEDYDALIPGYIAGTLGEAKRLLVEDQMRESVTFRKKVMQARDGAVSTDVVLPRAARRRGWSNEWSWAIAAGLLIAVSLIGLRLDLGILSVETGGAVTIQQVDGELFRVNRAGTFPVRPGDTLQLDRLNDRLRTAKDSRALLTLADGSAVEMNERSQLGVLERQARFGGDRRDSTIELDRGGVIVEAADQGDARLFVDTDDCKVEVKGTVFSVNHGLKGSRVSVLEGEVHVHAAGTEVLRPGDQVVTGPGVGRVPLEQEIAWSANLERHLALLAELTRLGRELDQVVATPGLRHASPLLDRTPEDALVYIAIPNLSDSLGDAYELVRSRVEDNPVLRDWWQRSVVSAGADRELDRAIGKIRDYGEQFGDEIVVALLGDSTGEVRAPLILAETAAPARLRDLLLADFSELLGAHEDAPSLVVLEGQPPAVTHQTRPDAEERFYVWLHDGFFAAGPEAEPIERFAEAVQAGGSRFSGTAFHQALARQYREGVEWLVAVDLERIMAGNAGDDTLRRLGLLDLRHLIVDRRDDGGRSDTRAVLTFSQARRGLASWLADPAPMGSLDFVSKDASLAAAFVMREPASLLDELFGIIGSSDEDFPRELDEFQREHGIDVRTDFAEPLGGEFTFAMDGPILPKPSWKLVVEVYDPARLQSSLELVVERLNGWRAEEGKQGFELTSTEAGNRVYRVIRSLQTGLEAHYTFAEGYLVATPSRVLLERALELRSLGLTLPRSHRFAELLPRDGQLNFSAVVYENLGPVLRPVAGALGRLQTLAPEQTELLRSLADEASASLTYAYGGRDRITIAASSQQGLFESGIELFRLQSLMELRQSIDEAVEQGS